MGSSSDLAAVAPTKCVVVVVTDLKCRMAATRISSAPPGGAYESFGANRRGGSRTRPTGGGIPAGCAQGCNPLSGGVGQRANSLAVIRHANFCVLRYGTMSFRCRGCPSPVFVAGPPSHPYLLSRNTYSRGEPTSLDYRGPAVSGMTLTAIIPLRAKERYHPSGFRSASRGDGTGVRRTRRTGIAPGNRPSAARH